MRTLTRPQVWGDAPTTPAPVQESDEAIVEAVLAGREGAFEILVRRHQQSVYAFLFRLVRNPDEAADLAQESFVKVFANLDQFNPEYRFRTWLFRIAANAAVDRRRRRKHLRSLADIGLEDEDGAATVPSLDPGPEEALRALETKERIEEALGSMPASYRQVLLMRFQGEMRYDRIAAITRLPLGTVKNRIFRAREMLRRALA